MKDRGKWLRIQENVMNRENIVGKVVRGEEERKEEGATMSHGDRKRVRGKRGL